MKKALIFGVCGFVGAHLTRELQNNGYEVYGSDVTPLPQTLNLSRFLPADLLDATQVKDLIMEVVPDYIINLAAVSSVGQSWNIPQKTISVNVNGALNILEAVRQCGNDPDILLVGSSEEYTKTDGPIDENCALNANNPYGISKMMLENFATLYRRSYGLKIHYVRSFNHTGAGQSDSFVLPSFCKQVAQLSKGGNDGVIYVGNLSVKRDIGDVRDVVRAYRLILEKGDCEQVYNVGSGKAYSLEELLDFIISLSPQRITKEIDHTRFRKEDNPVILCDNRLITESLGWIPQYDVFDTIRWMYNSFL